MFNLGLVFLFVYNALTAAKGVYLGNFLQKVHPFLVLTVCFMLVTLFFAAYNRLVDRKNYLNLKVLKMYRSRILLLNVSAVVGWTGFYLALKLIEPAIVTSITSASGPILTAIYFAFVDRSRQISRMEWGVYGAIALTMIFLVVESFLGLSAIKSVPMHHVLFGVLAALFCGAANVANTVLSKDLNNAGFRSRHIIPLRFYLLILLGFIFCPFQAWQSLLLPDVWGATLIIAIFGLSIPILLFQAGIENTNPLTVASVHATIPLFVLAAQLFDERLVVSQHSFFGASMITVLSLVSVVMNSYRVKRAV